VATTSVAPITKRCRVNREARVTTAFMDVRRRC
jgi:hypothetical protein